MKSEQLFLLNSGRCFFMCDGSYSFMLHFSLDSQHVLTAAPCGGLMGHHQLPACPWHRLGYYGSTAASWETGHADELPFNFLIFCTMLKLYSWGTSPLGECRISASQNKPCLTNQSFQQCHFQAVTFGLPALLGGLSGSQTQVLTLIALTSLLNMFSLVIYKFQHVSHFVSKLLLICVVSNTSYVYKEKTKRW